jgi:hypothetical protein
LPEYVAGLVRAAAAIRALLHHSGQQTFTRADLEAVAAVLDAEADHEDTPPMGVRLCAVCGGVAPVPVSR